MFTDDCLSVQVHVLEGGRLGFRGPVSLTVSWTDHSAVGHLLNVFKPLNSNHWGLG